MPSQTNFNKIDKKVYHMENLEIIKQVVIGMVACVFAFAVMLAACFILDMLGI